MKELFSLGEIYPSDFLKEGKIPRSEKVEMKLIMDDDGLVRLEKTASMDKMYGKYWYRSGINNTMKDALKDVVDSILKLKKLKDGDIWCDIACNDGTLLSFVPKNCLKIGVDPAEDSYRNEAINHTDIHIKDFFSKEIYIEEVSKKADVITSIAMFYDVPDPKQFIRDVYDILEDDGLWVMQLSYSPLMIEQMAFDNICHEHIYYYSMVDLIQLLIPIGFYVEDCELNNINGGSVRLYIRKGRPKHLSDIGAFKVQALCDREVRMNLFKPEAWSNWFSKIEQLKTDTLNLIIAAKNAGKSVWAYGASTKGNTLLQYFGLDNTMIDGIAERNPEKWGLRTIGSNIQIYSEEKMREVQPDYLLILPWHFINEFKERESEYLKKGGKFIVPCPTFQIIDGK